MKFGWEREEERLLRYMKIPPVKKLEWLAQMNKFMRETSSRKTKHIRQKLREKNTLTL